MDRHLGYVLKRFPRVSETFVANEILELERQGERVTVFAISRPDEAVTHGFLRDISAPVIYLPHRVWREPVRVGRGLARAWRRDRRGWLWAARYSLWPPRGKGLRRLLQAGVLCDELERAGITHVHAHFATAAARLANLAWRMGGPTYSVTAHAKDIWHEEVRDDHLRDKLALATFVATVTEANAAQLRGVLGAAAGRVEVIPNSVDTARLGAVGRRPERGRILTVARLIDKKGLPDLLAACGLLVDRGVDVHLDVVGDGPLRAELEAAAAAARVKATFAGVLSHEDVLDHYRRAAVFCLPCVVATTGDRDGLPTAVLEAMAVGVPVVTTAVNGLGEAVEHERSGLVVPEHDPAALAAALERVLRDLALAAQLATGARRRVEARFALPDAVARLGALFPAGP